MNFDSNNKGAAIHMTNAETYPLNGTWKVKIEYTLKMNGRAMTQYDILKYIKSVEIYIGQGPAKSVSSALSINKDAIPRYRPERGHLLYGLKEWFSRDGNILPMYDPANLV